MPLTFGSLFAGIGGLDLGLERAGMECRWQVEIDDYCRMVLEKHWPHVRRWDDVRTFPRPNTEQVDVMCGGFPCQPFSVAGQRKGASDERWMWPEFRRCIRILRPRYVLAENVPGLLSNDAGRDFGEILWDLARLGYDAEWSVLSACAMGAPHTRERVFLVAYPVCSGQPWFFRGQSQRKWFQREPDTVGGPTKVDTWNGGFRPDYVRVAHGIPNRVDRLRCLGNAVVPQVAEYIGRMIVEFDNTHTAAAAAGGGDG